MRLFVITQAVDRRDPILGFFHNWLAHIGKHAEKLTVIGQRVGEQKLVSDITVLSLQKESGLPTWRQILRFWKLQWQTRNDCDAVLVHMSAVWITLGAPIWLLTKKRLYLWYEARGTRWPLRVALRLVTKVFSASPYGMPVQTSKSVIMNHGIDTELFAPSGGRRDEKLIVTVGRITAGKRIEAVVDAFLHLPEDCTLSIIGAPVTETDKELYAKIQRTLRSHNAHHRVHIRTVTQQDLIPILQHATLLLHASKTGLDKAVLEAMAAGCPVVSCGEAFEDILPSTCWATQENLHDCVQQMLDRPLSERMEIGRTLRSIIKETHSLDRLTKRLVEEMT